METIRPSCEMRIELCTLIPIEDPSSLKLSTCFQLSPHIPCKCDHFLAQEIQFLLTMFMREQEDMLLRRLAPLFHLIKLLGEELIPSSVIFWICGTKSYLLFTPGQRSICFLRYIVPDASVTWHKSLLHFSIWAMRHLDKNIGPLVPLHILVGWLIDMARVGTGGTLLKVQHPLFGVTAEFLTNAETFTRDRFR